jgi:prolyl-tRNA synthetase
MRQVYCNIFSRCGLGFTQVEADSGAIGGSGSEEFMVDADTGEDAIAVCKATGYAANLEKAVSVIPAGAACEATVDMRKESTPGAKSCDDLLKLFPELPLTRMLKTVLYHVDYADGSVGVAAVMCRGDRELNDVKIINHLDALNIELASEAEVKSATGAAVGFAGPIGLADDIRLLADESVIGVEGFLCGGNETDMHYLDVHFVRDLPQPETCDFGTVQAGDSVVDGEGAIEITRGIEVGHIFQLGTKYSEAMGANFLDAQQKTKPMHMGCYGIGVSRVAASAIEQNHDEAGMIWPMPIAPYAVHLIQMKPGNDEQDTLAQEMHDALEAAGCDVLWDDRKKVSPGIKFKDADLVGVPIRITVGRDAGERGVEFSLRSNRDNKEAMSADAAMAQVIEMVKESGR